MTQKPARFDLALRAFLRGAALAGSVSFAMCGVRGWPKPPQMEDGYGARYSDAGVGCDNVEAPNTVPVGKTTEEICEACDELREKRARCGVKEQLGGRCRSLCQRPDWKRDQEPEQDIEAKTEAMKRWAKTPPDAGHDEDFLDAGVK
jgi:hypothetical protein